MKKGLIAIGATVVAVLAPVAVSSASHQENGEQGSPRDFAVGSGSSGDTRVGFAAHGGPTDLSGGGDPVTGHFRSGGSVLKLPDGTDVGEFQLEGPVTCLNVKGNQARLIYPVKQGRPEFMEQSEIFIFLEDNRKPGEADGQKDRDRVGFKILPDEDETPDDDPPSEQDGECDTEDEGATSELEKGDITVHDAP